MSCRRRFSPVRSVREVPLLPFPQVGLKEKRMDTESPNPAKKPFRVPNHPFEYFTSCINEKNQFDISKASFEDFMNQSVYWLIKSTIDDVVISAIDLDFDKLTTKSRHNKLKQLAKTLSCMNVDYDEDTGTYIGHRFFLLAIYKFPGHVDTITILLRYFLSKTAKTKVSRSKNKSYKSQLVELKVKQTLVANLKLILQRLSSEDYFLENVLEAELMCLNDPTKLPDDKLKQRRNFIEETIREHKLTLQKRIVDAAEFFGFLHINKLADDEDFDEILASLNWGMADAYQFEALCTLILISGQFFREMDRFLGSSYTSLYQKELEHSRLLKCGIDYIKTAVSSMKHALGRYHLEAQNKQDGPWRAFHKLQICVEMKSRRLEAEKTKISPSQAGW